MNYGDPRLPDDFWQKISPEPNSGCWLWDGNISRTAGFNSEQRGTLIRNKRVMFAHRYAYTNLVRPLTRHENLFRTCGITECCNPLHQRVSERKDEDRERGRELQRQYRNAIDPIARRARRSAIMKSNYGITLDEYDEMISKQGGRCAICGDAFEIGGNSRKRPCVDHCHRSGDVRGVLCSNCNTGIGYFKDNPLMLASAAKYTQSFAQREITFREKKPQTITCLNCGAKGHNSRTCDRRRST